MSSSDLERQACRISTEKFLAIFLMVFGLCFSFAMEFRIIENSVEPAIKSGAFPQKQIVPSTEGQILMSQEEHPLAVQVRKAHVGVFPVPAEIAATEFASPTEKPLQKTFWPGGAVIPADKVVHSAQEILENVGVTSSGYKKLLLETIAIESHFGRAVSYRGAHGITQVIVSTAKETLQRAQKSPDPKYRKLLSKTYDRNLSLTDNLKYNTSFNMAVFFTYIDLYGKASLHESQLKSREGRWKFYGRYWGAVGHGGASTRKQYFARAAEIESWLNNEGGNAWAVQQAREKKPVVTVASRNVSSDGGNMKANKAQTKKKAPVKKEPVKKEKKKVKK